MTPSQQRYLLTRTVAPSASPVSVAEVKADLRVDHADEDANIQGLIDAAAAIAGAPNGITGKSLVTETWALSVRCFDAYGRIYLPITPVQSVASITYYDVDDVAQSLDVADFYLYGSEDWAYIEKKDGVLPALRTRLDAITVTFVTGFGAAEDVPENIRQAIRLMVGHWYANRESVVVGAIAAEVPMGAELLLGASRKGWVS